MLPIEIDPEMLDEFISGFVSISLLSNSSDDSLVDDVTVPEDSVIVDDSDDVE